MHTTPLLLTLLTLLLLITPPSLGVDAPDLFLYKQPGGVFPLAASPSAPPRTYELTADDSLRVEATVFGTSCDAVSGPNATACVHPRGGVLQDGACVLILANTLPSTVTHQDTTAGTPLISAIIPFPVVGDAVLNATVALCQAGVLSVASSADDTSKAVVDTVRVHPKPSGSVSASPSQATVGSELVLGAHALLGGSPPYVVHWLLGSWSGPGLPSPGSPPRTLAVVTGVTPAGSSAASSALVVPDDLDPPGTTSKSTFISLVVFNDEGGVAAGINTASPVLLVPQAPITAAISSPAITAGSPIAITIRKESGGGTGPNYAVWVDVVDPSSAAVIATSATTTLTTPSILYTEVAEGTLTLPIPSSLPGSVTLNLYVRDSSNVTLGPITFVNGTGPFPVAPPLGLVPEGSWAGQNVSVGAALDSLFAWRITGGSDPVVGSVDLVRVSDATVLVSRSTSNGDRHLNLSSVAALASWLVPAGVETPIRLVPRCRDASGASFADPSLDSVLWVFPPPTADVVALSPDTSITAGGSLTLSLSIAGGVGPFVVSSLFQGSDGSSPRPAAPVSVNQRGLSSISVVVPDVAASGIYPVNSSLCITVRDSSGVDSGVACWNGGPLLVVGPPTGSVVPASPVTTVGVGVQLNATLGLSGTPPFTLDYYVTSQPTWDDAGTLVGRASDQNRVTLFVPDTASVWYLYVDVIDAFGVSSLTAAGSTGGAPVPGVQITVAPLPTLSAASIVVDPTFVSLNQTVSITTGPVIGGTGPCYVLMASFVSDSGAVLGPSGGGTDRVCGAVTGDIAVVFPITAHPATGSIQVTVTDALGAVGPATSSESTVVLLPGTAASASRSSEVLGLDENVFWLAIILPLGLLTLCLLLCILYLFCVRREKEEEEKDPEMTPVQIVEVVREERVEFLSYSSSSSMGTGKTFNSSTLESDVSCSADVDELFNHADTAINAARARMRYDDE